MLIHLTAQAELLTAILKEGQVQAKNPFGAAFNVDVLASSQTVACFSEMAALNSVATLADQHGGYGLGFTKAWMQAQGAAPVWYLPRDSAVQTEFFNTVRELAFHNRPDPSHPLWRVTPFVDYPRDAAPNEVAAPYDWRWEREWRIRGGLHFQPDDIALLFAPESQHAWAIELWKQETIEGWAGYMPPLVDTHWPRDQQETVIRQGPAVVEVEFPEWTESWIDGADTAPSGDLGSAWDDERRDLQAELRDELNGWLDEMARDDI
ncbi:abortive infection system antitoxin AbiGi family protein [Nocardioides alcanivorans]|uniref:abortive infection system antitoxin AbiGi family protein n=1 Tax=Nocardioides alcanivorans TaxID=2897352 RepID=UPI001F474944|nr:abortive infection system antitoxin AbiGi family protein [Nocardioides alcanivorans]